MSTSRALTSTGTLERFDQRAGVERFARRVATCQIELPYVKKATIATVNCGAGVFLAAGSSRKAAAFANKRAATLATVMALALLNWPTAYGN